MFVNELHPENAPSPIFVNCVVFVTKLEHPANVAAGNSVRFVGKVTVVNFESLANTPVPNTALLGTVTVVNL